MFANKKRIIEIIWIISAVVVFCFVISCWAAAADLQSYFSNEPQQIRPDSLHRNPVIFELVWSSFVIGCTTIFAGLVLFRARFKTVLNYGMLIGMGIVTMNLALSLTARYSRSTFGTYSSYNSLAFFSSIYFLLQIAMTILFLVYKDHMLEDSRGQDTAHDGHDGHDGRDTSAIMGQTDYRSDAVNSPLPGIGGPVVVQDQATNDSDQPR